MSSIQLKVYTVYLSALPVACECVQDLGVPSVGGERLVQVRKLRYILLAGSFFYWSIHLHVLLHYVANNNGCAIVVCVDKTCVFFLHELSGYDGFWGVARGQ